MNILKYISIHLLFRTTNFQKPHVMLIAQYFLTIYAQPHTTKLNNF